MPSSGGSFEKGEVRGSSRPGVWDVAALLLAGVWLARLAAIAAGARFATDECYHAYMAEWVATHRSLPRELPELYSGFAGYHPPLFHVLGAAWCAIFGTEALRHLNVFVSALLIAALWIGCRRLGAPAAAPWAVVLALASAWVSTYGVRLYVEQLTTLLVVLALMLVLHVGRSAGRAGVLALGMVLGFLLVAKHSALAVQSLVLLLAGGYAMRGERALARRYAVAGLVGLLVAAPFLIRNAALYGSPFYPAFARDLDPVVYELNRSRFTLRPAALYAAAAGAIGPMLGAFVVAALVAAAIRRRFSPAVVLLLACLAVVLVAPLQALIDTRHLLPAIVGMAFLSSLLVAGRVQSPRARSAISAVVIAAGAFFVLRMPAGRESLDAPPEALEAYEAVARGVPLGERVLSLHTYDTFYYSRRPATWPIPWGQRDRPIEMLVASSGDSIVAGFARHRLRWVLLWRPAVGERFDGANYPAAFVAGLEDLVASGRAALVWKSPAAALVRVGP